MTDLLKELMKNEDPWFNELWTEEWMSLCLINIDRFKNLWTYEESKVIQAINNTVHPEELSRKRAASCHHEN